jgi:hypothetical protein
MNSTAVDKAQFLDKSLHHDIIAMSINPQVSALLKSPVDTECTNSFFRAISGDPVDDTVGTVIEPRAI